MDGEKVIKGLEECAGNGNCTKCQYGKEKQALSCKKLLADALELIKSSRLIHTEHALYTVYEKHNGIGGDDMDREKVIKGLEICTKDIPMSNAVHKSDFCKECPYYNAENRYCWNQIVMMRDALDMLKEQEPVEPKYNARTNWYECGACHYSMTSGMHCRSKLIPAYKVGFCAKCGRGVKWNE